VEEPVPVFSFRKHPNLPISRFLNGRLGVVQPTFARSWLVVAWRWTNGTGMSPSETEQARSYYRDRQQGSLYQGWVKETENWPAKWRQLRASVPNPPPPKVSPVTNGQIAYDPDTHQFSLNCAEDAFRTAVHTFDSRRNRFGASSTAFRSWLTAQDTVFSNCDGTRLFLPVTASADLPVVIQQDRDYQIAAALFYAAHYPEALLRFRAIASEKKSPWSAISNYLIARTLYRLGSMPEVKGEVSRILADLSLTGIHGMTWNLMERAGLHERDQNYFMELARLLSSPGQDNGFREELWNYTDIYDSIIGPADPNREYWYGPDNQPPDEQRFRSVPMTDWIHSFQSRDPAAHARTLAEWKRSRSIPWLLAALTHANGKEPDAPALIDAAGLIPRQSPAYLTATWHRIRLNAERGRAAESRGELDALLNSPELRDLPSELNLFLSLRMVAAADFPEFLHFALRNPVLVVYSDNLGELPDQKAADSLRAAWTPHASLDRDATTLLNFSTPFDLLEQAARSAGFPTVLQQEIALTAFVRGLMLNRDLTRTANALEAATPDLKPAIAEWGAAATPAEKRFMAALLLLRRPEARPYLKPGISRLSKPGILDTYRDNWWCPMDIVQPLQRRQEEFRRLLIRTTPQPDFLETGTAALEIALIEKEGNAPEFLGRIVLSWAKDHPEDTRVAEALHRVVVATHLGCADIATPEISRSAFQLLHRRFPKSEWARRTPYWYSEYSIRQSLPK